MWRIRKLYKLHRWLIKWGVRDLSYKWSFTDLLFNIWFRGYRVHPIYYKEKVLYSVLIVQSLLRAKRAHLRHFYYCPVLSLTNEVKASLSLSMGLIETFYERQGYYVMTADIKTRDKFVIKLVTECLGFEEVSNQSLRLTNVLPSNYIKIISGYFNL